MSVSHGIPNRDTSGGHVQCLGAYGSCKKASNKPYGSSCFPSYLVQCLDSQLPLQWPPKAPCKASRAELTRIRHTAWPPSPFFAVVLLSSSSPPATWRCLTTQTPPPGSSRLWLGREVKHALFARQRPTRQHVQWSLRRGFVHQTILTTNRLGPCFKDTSWRFATCIAFYERVQAGSDSEVSSSRSGSTHETSRFRMHRKLTDPQTPATQKAAEPASAI